VNRNVGFSFIHIQHVWTFDLTQHRKSAHWEHLLFSLAWSTQCTKTGARNLLQTNKQKCHPAPRSSHFAAQGFPTPRSLQSSPLVAPLDKDKHFNLLMPQKPKMSKWRLKHGRFPQIFTFLLRLGSHAQLVKSSSLHKWFITAVTTRSRTKTWTPQRPAYLNSHRNQWALRLPCTMQSS